MRLVSVSQSLVDSVLARPILDEKGLILLGEGVRLSERLIERLQNVGIYSVYIQDQRTDDLIVDDPISNRTRQVAIEAVQKSVDELKGQSIRKSNVASRYQLGREFSKAFHEILSDIQSNKGTLTNLAAIFSSDGYLYHHSVNVTILATILGLAKGYNQKQISELGIGALLHDIGMTLLPGDVAKKVTPYTTEEFEIVKQHTFKGYEYIKAQDGVSVLSAHIALQHHERLNGTGYPRNLRGNDIHEYAQIVGICDVFNAMISSRNHRHAYLPHETLEYLMGGCGILFDYSLVHLFVKNVAVYPTGMTVFLNNGQTAVVVSANPEYPQRPTIRFLTTADGSRIDDPTEIDLTKHLTLMIVGVA